MNELQQIRDKYKNRDLIEIDFQTARDAVSWVTGDPQENILYWKEKYKDRLISLIKLNNGMISFLDKGVIVITGKAGYEFKSESNLITFAQKKGSNTETLVFNCYPFEFIDNELN